MRSSPILMLLVCSFALAACNENHAATPAPPPPEVSVVTVAPESVALSTEWIATLAGYVDAQIRPQVTGYLVRREYEEGALVRKGQVLFDIDARPFQALLAQARGQLGEAQAQLGKTERDLQRDRPLAEQRAIPQSQLDNDVQANLAAQAAVRTAQATVETAELNVSFTKVTSLVDGVAAIATAQIGDLVNPATLLTTVSQVDPIKAYFPLSERDYMQMAGRINTGRQQAKAPWRDGTLTLVLADGSEYPKKGWFVAADREIDPKTGTIRISAAFPNPHRELRPGQYGRVRAQTKEVAGALLIPQRAVTQLQGSYQLRVVGADGKVATKSVTMGERVGSRWIVDHGLSPGDRVVVEGPATRDGMEVRTKPFTPAASAEGAQ